MIRILHILNTIRAAEDTLVGWKINCESNISLQDDKTAAFDDDDVANPSECHNWGEGGYAPNYSCSF